MTSGDITSTRRRAARIAGLCYLLALPPAVFAEFYAFGRLVLANDVAATARNIVDHGPLFRLGIASNLFVFALDVVLIAALYVVLKPVNPAIALVAVFWRLIETTLLVVTTVADLVTLRIVGGTESHGLIALSLGTHGAAYSAALFFAGLGTALFCFLWLTSRLLPRPLAAWGVFAGGVLAVSIFALIIAPEVRSVITVAVFGGPIFTFELTAGFWLLLKGLPVAVGYQVRHS